MSSSSKNATASEVFTAVPKPDLEKSNLQEPLLAKPEEIQTTETPSLLDDPSFLRQLKVLSFTAGSIVALVSQYVLSKTLWDDAILAKSTKEVVLFSFIWSCWTCLMIFSVMMLVVQGVNKAFGLSASTTKARWDDVVFFMEAHHVVGSLISISVAWIMVDALRLGMPAQVLPNVLFFCLTAAWYGLCMFCLGQRCGGDTQDDDDDDNEATRSSRGAINMLPTYQLIASTLGLIVGVCSQFILSFVLWQDHMTKPIVDHVVGFSMLWSVCTVVITFVGCATLRCLTVDEPDRLNAERAFLRMESHYVFSSLCGICLAWILIDMVMGMTDQIVPSLVMLTLSLLAFRGILVCFPEEQCLAELKERYDAQRRQQGDEESLVVVTV